MNPLSHRAGHKADHRTNRKTNCQTKHQADRQPLVLALLCTPSSKKRQLPQTLALLLILAATFLPARPLSAQQPGPQAVEAWKANKFSMFIHFGIYSVLGGVWEGRPISRGLSEQIQAHAGIYSDTYAHTADRFDPVHWNPDSVALLAKAAGMRSIIITTKHHDGFCMFHTATTEFNVVDATPYKRDIVGELAAACQRHGLRFGVYFSLIDWHFPQASPISSHNSDYITPEHHEYNKKQVTELMTHYGAISEIWFDMGSQSAEQSRELANLVHRLQPDCMISSRLGNDQGDFTVMGDNQEPNYRIGVPWQSPASFFDETWGYRSWQVRGEESDKTREKLTSLIHTVCSGGNYLLNIGPKGDGSIVPFEKDVLLTIGQWLQKNAEAVYGTQPDPFDTAFDWGSVTTRPGKLYLHLLHPPSSGRIFLPGLQGRPARVYILGESVPGSAGQAQSQKEGISLVLPENARATTPAGSRKSLPDNGASYKVIVLEFKGDYTLTPTLRIPIGGPSPENASLVLNHTNAFKYYSNSTVDYNSRYTSTIRESWTLEPKKTLTVTPTLYYSAGERGRTIDIGFESHSPLQHPGNQSLPNSQTLPVTLDNDTKVPLHNDTASLTRSPLYLYGPADGGIDDIQTGMESADTTKTWPNEQAKENEPAQEHRKGWVRLPDEDYSFPAGMSTVYYVLQEISSPSEQACLIRINSSADGVLVLLNGKRLLVHNNPSRLPLMQDIVLLPLQKGNNRLLIKLFNNFRKKTGLSIDPSIEQTLYQKKLDPLALHKKQLYTLSWQLDHPATPHQELGLPNLSLRLE